MVSDSLGNSAARGVFVTSVGQLVRLATQLVGVILLSRLLEPGDFGILAMTVAIVGVGEILRDFGLSSAAIQAATVTHQQRTNLFWLNSALGASAAVIVFVAAPLIGSIYDSQLVVDVARVLSITFILNGLSAQLRAGIARDLRFGALATVDASPPVIGLAIAGTAGVLGFGVWALVLQQVVATSVGFALAASLARWIPGVPRRAAGMGYFLRYGLNLSAAQLVAYASRNADYVILGLRAGPVQTGLYNRAFELVMNPLNQVNAPATKVAVPVLSRLQSQTDRYNAFLITGQRAMLLVVIPVLSLGAVLAWPLVPFVLGDRWAPVAPILQVLALAGICRVAGYATYWIALSRGATGVSLRVNLVSAPILVACVLLGSNWGAIGVGLGTFAAAAIAWIVSLVWYSRAVNAPGWRLFTTALSVLAANLVPSAVALLTLWTLRDSPEVVQVIVGVLTYGSVWLLEYLLIPVWRKDMASLQTIIRQLRR